MRFALFDHWNIRCFTWPKVARAAAYAQFLWHHDHKNCNPAWDCRLRQAVQTAPPLKNTDWSGFADQPKMALAFPYTALPVAVLPFTAQKPVILSSLRACFTASIHLFNALFAQFFLPRADFDLLTILPVLLFVSVSLVRPPTVFCLLPRKTRAFASLPRAMVLVRLTFMAFFIAFMDFLANFITFMPPVFMAAFMVAFIAPPLTVIMPSAMAGTE